MKRRAATLATLSIASFLALAYWAVSNTAKPVQQTELNAALHGPHAAPAIEPVATRDPIANAATPEHTPEPIAEVQAPAPARAEPAEPVEPAAPSPTTPMAASTPPANSAEHAAADEAPQPATQPSLAPDKTALAMRAAPAAATPPPAQPLAAAAPAKIEHAAALAPPAEPAKAAAAAHARNPLLVVRALPEGAVRLWLDGQRMSNPFDVRLPRDSKHRIDARGEGYETSGQTVRLEADAKLTFTLRRAVPVPATPHASSTRDEHAKASDKQRRGAGFVSVSPY